MGLSTTRVQEALAARALCALNEEENEAAEALIGRHLPSCAACRQREEDFESIAGELALAAQSGGRPRTCWRACAATSSRPAAPPRHGRALAVPPRVIARARLRGCGACTSPAGSRAPSDSRRDAAELISAVSVPGSKIVPLAAPGTTARRASGRGLRPRQGRLYVVGNMPPPARTVSTRSGWARRARSPAAARSSRSRGSCWSASTGDGAAYDHVLITEEHGSGSDHAIRHRVAESDL